MGVCVGWGMDEPWLTMNLWLSNLGDVYSTVFSSFVYVWTFPNNKKNSLAKKKGMTERRVIGNNESRQFSLGILIFKKEGEKGH